jgi:ATP-dependent RNA helicase RhlE
VPQYKTFSNLKLSKQLLNALNEIGYDKPTPIQEKVIPAILSGRDIIGIAPTGTGKTAAYLIPLLKKLNYAMEDHPRALILAPTRELAIQISDELKQLSKYYDIRAVCLYGGTGMKTQIEEIRAGRDIVITTPGRFLDLYRMEILLTKLIRTLIIDEADKMMDMGFRPQINRILEILPFKKRQNLLFSATFHAKVENLAIDFLDFPVKIDIQPTRENIEQYFYKVPNLKTKIYLLSFLLKNTSEFRKVIIFAKTKKTADDIYKFIVRKVDENVKIIHANKGQNTRINTINEFRQGGFRILVTTDLISRGIDISGISHVINFDVPVIYEDYIHRIGRTGRIYHEGVSLTFVNEPDEFHLLEIERLTGKKIPERKLPAEIEIRPTEEWEKKKNQKEIDKIKRKLDQDFKGAFHKITSKKGEKRKLLKKHKKRS